MWSQEPWGLQEPGAAICGRGGSTRNPPLQSSLGSGVESHRPALCFVHVRAAVSWFCLPSLTQCPLSPCTLGSLLTEQHLPASMTVLPQDRCKGQGHKGRLSDVGPWPAIPKLWRAWQCRLPSWHLVPRLGRLEGGAYQGGAEEQGHSCHLALQRHWGTAPGREGIPAPHWGMGQPCRVSLHEGVSGEGGLRSCTK